MQQPVPLLAVFKPLKPDVEQLHVSGTPPALFVHPAFHCGLLRPDVSQQFHRPVPLMAVAGQPLMSLQKVPLGSEESENVC